MKNQQVILSLGKIHHLTLGETLDCGQAFRWEKLGDEHYGGVAMGEYVELWRKEEEVFLKGTTKERQPLWENYLDLSTDYGLLKETFSQNPHMAKAISFAPGIRVLRQEPFETLITFIISQNNNIKRIKGIVLRLCESFGTPIVGTPYFAFPTPERLAKLTVEDLAPLKAGFRGRYILDAAQKVASGQVDLLALSQLPLDDARKSLMEIVGVGRKVADCALLFGAYRIQCYPVDVWIKRVDAQFFPQGLPPYLLPHAGIAQQYLFHYARVCPEAFTFLDK